MWSYAGLEAISQKSSSHRGRAFGDDALIVDAAHEGFPGRLRTRGTHVISPSWRILSITTKEALMAAGDREPCCVTDE